MSVDVYTRAATKDRLPSRQQIDEISDVEALRDILSNIIADAKGIETDLEFRSDDLATDDWEARARKALTAHRVCIGNLNRRIAFLQGRKGPSVIESQQAKAARKMAEAELVAAQAERKRLKADEEKEKSFRQMLQVVSRQSFLLHFHKAACEVLDRQTMEIVARRARSHFEESLYGGPVPESVPAAHPQHIQEGGE